MRVDARMGLPAPRGGHLDPGAGAHGPQCGGREMTQDSARTAGEHGSHPAPVSRQEAATDHRVDPSMHGIQPADLDSVVNRPGSKTKV
jgi:hypothetical protein